jgi:hypothetical protein
VDFRRAQFGAAQLGRKAGKRDVLGLLLGAGDLPGGKWQVLDQRTWRTGLIGPPSPWGERARKVGSVTGWRSFRHESGARFAWIQIAPLVSPADARESLAGIGERGLANLGASVRLISEHDVRLEPFTGASAVWAREQHTEGRNGSALALLLAGAVRHWLMVIALSGSPSWDWQAASDLAALQAARMPAASGAQN